MGKAARNKLHRWAANMAATKDQQEPWTPFERGDLGEFPPASVIAEEAAKMGVPVDAYEHQLRRTFEDEVWLNSRYQVNIKRNPPEVEGAKAQGWPDIIHLSIKRRDKLHIHDWRDLQRIKNELVGPEHEAIEIYPAESRLVDTSNQYHLWCFATADARVPIGWGQRFVKRESTGGAVQRPMED
jgi:hypothetical protein